MSRSRALAGNCVGVKIQDKYYFSRSGFGCAHEVMKVKWSKRKTSGRLALKRSFFFFGIGNRLSCHCLFYLATWLVEVTWTNVPHICSVPVLTGRSLPTVMVTYLCDWILSDSRFIKDYQMSDHRIVSIGGLCGCYRWAETSPSWLWHVCAFHFTPFTWQWRDFSETKTTYETTEESEAKKLKRNNQKWMDKPKEMKKTKIKPGRMEERFFFSEKVLMVGFIEV